MWDWGCGWCWQVESAGEDIKVACNCDNSPLIIGLSISHGRWDASKMQPHSQATPQLMFLAVRRVGRGLVTRLVYMYMAAPFYVIVYAQSLLHFLALSLLHSTHLIHTLRMTAPPPNVPDGVQRTVVVGMSV